MIVTTTPYIEGKKVSKYLGIVTDEAIMGADAVVGVDLDYETLKERSMLMVTVSGTAVKIGS